MIAIKNSRWVAAMEFIDRKLRPCLRKFTTLKGKSDYYDESIFRMPGKAMHEDTEDSGLQKHAKIINLKDLWYIDRDDEPTYLDESLINRMLSLA